MHQGQSPCGSWALRFVTFDNPKVYYRYFLPALNNKVAQTRKGHTALNVSNHKGFNAWRPDPLRTIRAKIPIFQKPKAYNLYTLLTLCPQELQTLIGPHSKISNLKSYVQDAVGNTCFSTTTCSWTMWSNPRPKYCSLKGVIIIISVHQI